LIIDGKNLWRIASGLAETCGIVGFEAALARVKKNDLAPEVRGDPVIFRGTRQPQNSLSSSFQINKKASSEEKTEAQGFLVTFWPQKVDKINL